MAEQRIGTARRHAGAVAMTARPRTGGPDKRGKIEPNGLIVSYCRVSTQRQGRSGLGLESQRQIIEQYTKMTGGTLAGEFVEVESGKKSNRPELAKALDECKRIGARLLIAKLDRLARNVAFIANLMESGVDFAAADMPDANRLTLHIMAAVAEAEGRAISQRTKDAIAVKRQHARNGAWGPEPKLTPEQTAEAVAALDDGIPFADLCAQYGVDRSTLHRARSKMRQASQ